MDTDTWEILNVISRSLQSIAESLDRLAQDQAEFYKHILQKGVLIMDEKRPGSGITEQPQRPAEKKATKKTESKEKGSKTSK